MTTQVREEEERRHSTEEQREAYLRSRKLAMEMVNTLGRKAIVGVLIFGGFWVGRVEKALSSSEDTRLLLAATVETVSNLGRSVSQLQEVQRADVAQRTSMLVELQKLNGQIEALRIESQARTVRGN